MNKFFTSTIGKTFLSAMLCLLINFNYAFAQDGDDDMSLPDSLFNMSFEALMNIKVVSASKKEELRTDSPFSIAVISKETILQSGATSLAEVFRLVPGMVVREQSPGNFEVFIRGYDYVTPVGNQSTVSESTMFAVLIDGRPVFNYFQGGTFWETLPVAIEQIERIEIISGAASAMYGQNAASGVMNIITSKESEEKTTGSFSAQLSNVGDMLTNGSVIHRLNDKWTSGFAFRQAFRKRDFKEYFSYPDSKYVVRDSLKFRLANVQQRFPQPDVAQDAKSVNAFFRYVPAENKQMLINCGVERSIVQKIYQDNQQTPLSSNFSESQFIDISGNFKGINAQVSYIQGKQEVLGSLGWGYKYQNFDSKLEYDGYFKNLRFRPGISYRFSAYDDAALAEIIGKGRALLNGEIQKISTLSSYLMADYSLNKFRFGGIGRIDFYDVPEKTFFNYNLYATYKPSESLMFRLVAGKANRGSFILDAYSDQEMQLGQFSARLLGNQNLSLTQMQTFEFGIRTPLALGLLFDLEVFRAELSDFYTNMAVTADSIHSTSQLKNIPTKVIQNGFTAAVVFLEKKTNLQMNAYVTVQKSDLQNAWTEDSAGNITYVDREHKATPSIFGGVNVFYKHKKLSLNLQTWYMSEQSLTEISYKRQNNIADDYLTLKSYVGLNAKISYHVTSSWTFYINGRNLLNGGQVQTFMGDKLPAIFFAGINLKW